MYPIPACFRAAAVLGTPCGTNIETEDVEFTKQQPNLTYIDKVFSFNKDTASPILFNLNTGGPYRNNFVTELFLEGSSFFPCTLSPNAVFEIDNSFVAVELLSTRPPGNIDASQVTLDGFPVDSISYAQWSIHSKSRECPFQSSEGPMPRQRSSDKGIFS